MTQAAGKSSSTKKDDFKAGGRLQAQLRLLASKELEKKPKLYMIDGDLSSIATDTKRAGFFAESHSLYALANASHLDLRIWAWDNTLKRWDFYVICSDAPSPKKTPTILYLRLQAEHYEWLRPSKEVPQVLCKGWIETAKANTKLNGGGNEDGLIAKPCLSLASTDHLPAGLPQIMIQVAYLAYQLKELKHH